MFFHQSLHTHTHASIITLGIFFLITAFAESCEKMNAESIHLYCFKSIAMTSLNCLAKGRDTNGYAGIFLESLTDFTSFADGFNRTVINPIARKYKEIVCIHHKYAV